MSKIMKGVTKTALRRVKLPRFAKLEYWVWNFVFSFALFYALYIWLFFSAPNGLWKFLNIFVTSLITGLVGSVLASWESGYWPWGFNLNHIFKFFLISLIQSILVFYSVYGILLSEMTWDRILINLLLVKISVTAVAYAIALSASTKINGIISKLITG